MNKRKKILLTLILYLVIIVIPIFIFFYSPSLLPKKIQEKIDTEIPVEMIPSKDIEPKDSLQLISTGEWNTLDLMDKENNLLAKAKIIKMKNSSNYDEVNLIIRVYSLNDSELSNDLFYLINEDNLNEDAFNNNSKWNVKFMLNSEIDRAADIDTPLYNILNNSNYFFENTVIDKNIYFVLDLEKEN